MARLLTLGIVLLAVVAGELAWLIVRPPQTTVERVIVEEGSPKSKVSSPKSFSPTLDFGLGTLDSEVEARRLINDIQRAIADCGPGPHRVPIAIHTPYSWQWIDEHFSNRGWRVRWSKEGRQQFVVLSRQ